MNHRTLSQMRSATTTYTRHGFSWLELGAKNNKSVIILHGITGGKDDMLPLAERYVERGYRVYCPDLPGHGGSRMISVPMFGALGQWLDRYIKLLNTTPDLIVSNSYASAITYSYMQQGFLPATTRVVLACPTPRVERLSRLLDVAGQHIPPSIAWRIYNSSLAQKIRIKKLYRGSDVASYKWLVESERRKLDYIAPKISPILSKSLFNDNPYNLPPLPESIQRRTTVVIGERDNVLSTKGRDFLHNILPYARIISAGPTGHIIHFEALDAFIDAH